MFFFFVLFYFVLFSRHLSAATPAAANCRFSLSGTIFVMEYSDFCSYYPASEYKFEALTATYEILLQADIRRYVCKFQNVCMSSSQ